MRWKQALFLIIINAVLSLVISVAVVVTWDRTRTQREVVVTRVAEATTVSRLLETATPLPRPHVYAVRPGDNLSSIASGFGVSLVELQRVNNIDDPNLLRVGQELIIPLDGPLRITPQLPRPATPEGGTAPPLPTSAS